ncbi:hypothetical protein EJB05_04134, partial [Eragrostis curvula]
MSTSSNTGAVAANPGRRCAACKNQRRKCAHDCILAPYFPASDPQRYACVQRIFGASNIARMLQSLPVHDRGKAADTMAMEAHRRVQDPVYGCAGVIARLQDEIRAVQSELARTEAQIAVHAAAAAGAQPAAGNQLNAQVQGPMQQQGDALMVQEPFPGLDALLNDVHAGANLFDDDM